MSEINAQSSQLERLRAEKIVRVHGIVLAKLAELVPATECKVEGFMLTGARELQTTGERRLTNVRLFYQVLLRPSGRKLEGPDDMSVGPWEPGCDHTVLLPGYVIEGVVS